jgi:hypothetical protein
MRWIQQITASFNISSITSKATLCSVVGLGAVTSDDLALFVIVFAI